MGKKEGKEEKEKKRGEERRREGEGEGGEEGGECRTAENEGEQMWWGMVCRWPELGWAGVEVRMPTPRRVRFAGRGTNANLTLLLL